MYTVSIGTSSKGIFLWLMRKSICVSNSYRSPLAWAISAITDRGKARRPVCVSLIFMPKKRRNTAMVIRFPLRLREGTWAPEKSRTPKTMCPPESILSDTAAMSPAKCCPSASAVTTPAPSGRLSKK